jgi:hypothetical protein
MKKRYERLGAIRSIFRSHFASGTRPALCLGAAGSGILSAKMVDAQASPDAAVGEPTVIEERGTASSDAGDIIVTAGRTDERLQDVPVSVTVIGGQQLVEQRISTEKDLQKATPGTRLPGYALFSGRLEWNNISGSPISAALWGENLFGKESTVAGSRSVLLSELMQ